MGESAMQSKGIRTIQEGLRGLVTDMFPDIFPGMFEDGDESTDPAIGSEDTGKGYAYGSVKGDAFRTGAGEQTDVALDDIDQGVLGDCYFMAALGALAKAKPDWIKGLIKENKDAKNPSTVVSYTVTFYNYWGNEVTETVTPTFPVDKGGNPVYAQPTLEETVGATYELWPMIMEKAYAQWYEGYDEIESGYVDTALEHLTGKDASLHYRGFVYTWYGVPEPEPVLDWFTRMNTDFKANKAVCITTYDGVGKKGNLVTGTNGVAVSGSHVYVVDSINLNGAASTVTLYNPHGHDHPVLNLTQFETCVKRYGCLDEELQ